MIFKFLFQWNKVLGKINTGSLFLIKKKIKKKPNRILYKSIPEKPNILLDNKRIYTEFLLSSTTLASEKQMFNV